MHRQQGTTKKRDGILPVAQPVHLHRHTPAARARESANMVSANMVSANMVSANMVSDNMVSANMVSANMVSANMVCANMVSANMVSANRVFVLPSTARLHESLR